MPVEKVIRKHFRTSRRRIEADNLPVLVRWGTRMVLPLVFAEAKLNYGVEVGTKFGAYAMALCKANPDLHLTCVDPYFAYGGLNQEKQDVIRAKAIENLKPYNVTMLQKTSIAALDDFEDESLDFVFIDGAHDYDNACVDLIFWAYKVRFGGVIALHDYMAGHGAGVMKAIDGYTHCHNVKPWYVTREKEATAFWVMRQKPRYVLWVSPWGNRLR
jgi:predicted O-methyltransferase YrrM